MGIKRLNACMYSVSVCANSKVEISNCLKQTTNNWLLAVRKARWKGKQRSSYQKLPRDKTTGLAECSGKNAYCSLPE